MNNRFRSVGRTLLVVFFTAGALICLIVVFALVFPDGYLESIWRLKPEARTQFHTIGTGISIGLMTVVAAACGSAAVGLAKGADWGRRVAIGVLAINLLGDSFNALLMRDPKTLIGLPIGGLIILYLVKTKRPAQ